MRQTGEIREERKIQSRDDRAAGREEFESRSRSQRDVRLLRTVMTNRDGVTVRNVWTTDTYTVKLLLLLRCTWLYCTFPVSPYWGCASLRM